jgi:nitrite reductase/ring-hydroxylating ferredoxin subunit
MALDENNGRFLLCDCDDLPETSSKAFFVETKQQQLELFIIHHNLVYHAYLNRCPHTGVNLNWQPDQFYDYDHKFIQCSTHGALFRIDSGYCIRGPCAGLSLTKLELLITENKIYLDLDDSISY